MQLLTKYRMNPNARITTIHQDPVVYDLVSGNWVAITPDAQAFLKDLESDRYIGKELDSNQIELLDAMLQLKLVDEHSEYITRVETPEIERLMPTSAYFHVSFTCNLTCPTCYSFDDRRNNHPDLETTTMKTIFRKLREGGVADLIISGGEPFVRKDMIELLEYCKNELQFSYIVVITNGTLLKESMIERLKGVIDQVAISIDGYDESTNSPIRGKGNFEKAIKTVRLLKKHNIPSHIITTMHKGNVVDSNKFLELGEELGIHVNFSLFTPSGKGNANNSSLELGQEDLVYLGMLLAKNPGKASIAETPCAEGLTVKDRCGIGTHLVSVNADGTVYPCHITMLPNLAMGNLLQQDLKEIMYTSAIAAQCRDMTVETVGHCKSCDYKIFCGGGCRANALYALDDIMGHDPHCSLNKAFLKEAVETAFGPEPAATS